MTPLLASLQAERDRVRLALQLKEGAPAGVLELAEIRRLKVSLEELDRTIALVRRGIEGPG